MAHIRTQIRQRVKAALESGLPSTYRVFSSRKYAINHEPGGAMVDMRFSNDQTQLIETMGDERVHVASLYIRVQRSTTDETTLDDAMDADEVAVVAIMEAINWGDLLEDEPELLQTNFTENESSGFAIGGIVMRFDCEYRIARNDPETVIE